MDVRKIMTKNPACCTPDSTLQEVAHMMEMYDCGCIPVVESHKTMNPTGTITDRDIAIRTFAANRNPLEMKASDIMTTDIVTVTPDTSVEECLNVMAQRQIRRVLVVDNNGRCTGIVAQADLAESASHPAQTAHFLREVSETDSDREQDFNSNRSFDNENRIRIQNNTRAFSLNETRRTEKHRKPRREKESFFNSTTLLALLGSIGIGAGLRYYFGPETENKKRAFTNRKVKTYNLDADNTDKSKPTVTSFPTPAAHTSTKTTGKDTISGSVDTFDRVDSTFGKTNDDADLKPITEVGKTATNT